MPAWLDQMIPESAILDPESPLAPEKLVDEFVLSEQNGSASGAILRGLLILICLGGLAAAWRWTALGEWVDLETISAWTATLGDDSSAPLWVVGAFLLGGIVCFPVTVLLFAVAYELRRAVPELSDPRLDSMQASVDPETATLTLRRGTLVIAVNLGPHPMDLEVAGGIDLIASSSAGVSVGDDTLVVPPDAVAIFRSTA